MKISGSCHCGAVGYQVDSDGPYPYQKCYCSICRKTSGGEGYAINLLADARTLKINGEKHLATYQAKLCAPESRKSEHRRLFCRHCGSHLWAWHSDWPDFMHPIASSVDSELPRPPYYTHMMLNYKPGWVQTFSAETDRCFDEYPDESIAEWHTRLTSD